MAIGLVDLGMVTLAAMIAAGLLLTALKHFEHARHRSEAPTKDDISGPTFLFEDNVLMDATPDGTAMISGHSSRMGDYDAVIHVLAPYFTNLNDRLTDLVSGKIRIDGNAPDGFWVEAERTGSMLRITVRGGKAEALDPGDAISRGVHMCELAMLRDMTQFSPQLIWQEDVSGKLLWANQAYLSFYDRRHGRDEDAASTWPNTSLFPDLHETLAAKGTSLRRISVKLPQQKAEQWFDVTSVRRGDSFLHFGADANAVVRADLERRNFVQTLSKTFADLSIGLAIFDKHRQLTTFNPALLDLSQLPIDFLSMRPTLEAVLDRLRESRMLPEPKDYAGWREQFTALELAAKKGNYTEIWDLPEGQTYRVTGRPHPDGAFAFLFEDISAEMSLTRRFRSDIETGQAVLDTLPEAIAVFSSAGTMVMSNRSYAELWGDVVDERVKQHELQTAIQIWQSRCTPTQMWGDLRSFIHLLGMRKPWSDDAILDDGRHLRCHAAPISGGMTMVKFTFAPPMKPVIRKLTMPDTALLAARR